MYSNESQQLVILFWMIGIAFGILNLWALIVVIAAGTRYLKRTSPQRSTHRSNGAGS